MIDIIAFRKRFPEFADEIAYPDDKLQMYYEDALCYVDGGCGCREKLVFLMMAHLLTMCAMASGSDGGNSGGILTSAKIDMISVSFSAPSTASASDWFYSQTSYGIQFQSLLNAMTPPLFYIGGLPETRAFRKVGGRY